jgi:hypothetical protein
MLRPASRPVNILDPKQKLPAGCARKIMGAHCRKGMTDMKSSIRAGRKPRCRNRRSTQLWCKIHSGYFSHRNTISGGRCPLDVKLCANRLAIVKML